MGDERILCYSPYNYWRLHGFWEFTALHGLKQRGVDVKVSMCDAQFTDCDMFWEATLPRTELSCVYCQAKTTELARNMQMPYDWLGKYLGPEDRVRSRQWTDALGRDDLMTAQYENWEIGSWVRSSVHSHFRESVLTLEDPRVEETYRSYAYSTLLATFGLERLIDSYQPTRMFLFNGRLASLRAAFELGRDRGIPIVCHERGYLKDSVRFFENRHCLSIEHYREIWDRWGDIPLSLRELNTVSGHLEEREQGLNLSWYAFSPAPQNVDEVVQKLNLNLKLPIWTIFTSSDDEVASFPDWKGPFATHGDWVRSALDFAGSRPDLQLVVRVHPNTTGDRAIGSNQNQVIELNESFKNATSNVRVVSAEMDVSSYTLMDLSSVGMVYASTVGLEMAAKGKNVVVASASPVRDLPFVDTINHPDDFPLIMKRLYDAGDKGPNPEIARGAFRFGYNLFFRFNIPFPLVKMQNFSTGSLAYSQLSELAPGKDVCLDRICNIIMGKEKVVEGPRITDRSRSPNSETAWLEARFGNEGQQPLPRFVKQEEELRMRDER